MTSIGHNGIYGGFPTMRVIRIHINDWAASTRGLTLAEEGFFWRFTLLLYEAGGFLVDKDDHNARSMMLDVRSYKHHKARLVALGKIRIEDGALTQSRVVKEINAYVAECKRRSEAAREREEKKRSDPVAQTASPAKSTERSSRHRADFDPISTRSRGEVDAKLNRHRVETEGDLSGKANENNGGDTTTVPTAVVEPSCARTFLSLSLSHKEEDRGMCADAHPAANLIDDAFDEFWRSFPPKRRRDKVEARKVFTQIITGKHPRKLRAKAEEIIAAVKAGRGFDPEEPPLPTTWLNKGRFLDDDPREQTAPDTRAWWQVPERVAAALADPEKFKGFIRQNANGIWRIDRLGPPHGQPGSIVTNSIAEELGLVGVYDQRGMLRPGKKPKFDTHST